MSQPSVQAQPPDQGASFPLPPPGPDARAGAWPHDESLSARMCGQPWAVLTMKGEPVLHDHPHKPARRLPTGSGAPWLRAHRQPGLREEHQGPRTADASAWGSQRGHCLRLGQLSLLVPVPVTDPLIQGCTAPDSPPCSLPEAAPSSEARSGAPPDYRAPAQAPASPRRPGSPGLSPRPRLNPLTRSSPTHSPAAWPF